MIRNYFKVAIRNLLRYKGFSIINILSLSIGVTGCLLITLFVLDEKKFDRFIPDGQNIYRVYNKRTDNLGTTEVPPVPPAYATYLKQQFPEVDTSLRIMLLNAKLLVEAGDVKIYEEKWLATEPQFFKFFPLAVLEGDKVNGLSDPNSIVITQSLSQKLFGKNSAVGQRIKINKSELVVKTVLADLPEHFHLDFAFLMPLQAMGVSKERMESWSWNQFFTYVKTRPNADVNSLAQKFDAFVQQKNKTENPTSDDKYEPQFQALKDIYLHSAGFTYDIAKRGNATYIKALVIIALFVLVIACFNFVNLATARSLRRAKEIGVRKAIGAGRRQLLIQFTGESVLLTMVAVTISGIATVILLPFLNNFTGKHIEFHPLSNPVIGLLLLAAAILIGLIAGIYPALVLSGLKAIRILKGGSSSVNVGGRGLLRQTIVVIQFGLSALLIVCTLIVYKQISYLHQKDLGFNKDQVVFFPMRQAVQKRLDAFTSELKTYPGITSITSGYGLPGNNYAGDQIILPGKEGEKALSTTLFIGDANYLKTLDIKLVAGRDFIEGSATDREEGFIINETAVKEFGFGTPEKALGQKMNWNKWEPDSIKPVKQGQVIGVINDFHYSSLHDKVGSLVLQQYPQVNDNMVLKIEPTDVKGTIAFLTTTWNKFSPDFPLEYKFLNESFGKMYVAEDKLSQLLSIFTAMAIFVGCMGLFGLAAFSAEQKTREIGIRKVLGASPARIVSMLSVQFLKPVFIASLIAFPVSWWLMSKWLRDFPYRVTIEWWVFAIAAVLALLVALITISAKTIHAATANPVKSLKTE